MQRSQTACGTFVSCNSNVKYVYARTVWTSIVSTAEIYPLYFKNS